MEELTIGEVARRTGLRTSALRYYEEVGILPAPRRLHGRRRYDAEVLRVLEVIRFARQAGFTLEEIRTLFHGFGAETPLGERWQALAQAKLLELDALMDRARRMQEAIRRGIACGCVRIEDCALAEPRGTGEPVRAVLPSAPVEVGPRRDRMAGARRGLVAGVLRSSVIRRFRTVAIRSRPLSFRISDPVG
ncbi:MAG TPA: MerR family transcriptional regulator [Longimicrobiaceae bacterium]|nr:MerR family transcriptional regulator [Longimicrobiaceae bacterium]